MKVNFLLVLAFAAVAGCNSATANRSNTTYGDTVIHTDSIVVDTTVLDTDTSGNGTGSRTNKPGQQP